jgi:hypothetical protein
MARTIESAQELDSAIYESLRKLQEDHDVDLDTLEEYLRDAVLQMRADAMIDKKYARVAAMSTTELTGIVEESGGEMNLAQACTLRDRLSKPGAAHSNDVAPQVVCDAQGLEQGSTWLECVKARIYAQ